MTVEFLSKTRINKDFLTEVIDQLKESSKEKQSSENEEILGNLIKDLTLEENSSTKFFLQENEYNFLIQNDKSLWAEYLIFRYKFKVYPTLRKLTKFPTHLLVEPVSYCNFKCPMCFQSDSTFTKKSFMGHMELDLFKKIIDEAVKEKCRDLTMASRGEPTLHPKFGEILKYAKDKFFDFKINTNAMLLDEEKSHQILENGVTELVFSVDSADKEEYERIRKNGKFEQVLSNIKQFKEIRDKEYPESKCKTRVSGVKPSKNFDVDHFVKFWEQFVDNVACVAMLNRWDSYHNKQLDENPPCTLLWERIYIWFDGIVNPCDYDYKSRLQVGNIKDASIKEIWNNEKYNKLREGHLKGNRNSFIPCDRCEY